MTRDAGASAPSPWKPFDDRRRERDAKRMAVLRMAAHLFVEQGYHRTKLTDVAERLHITKTALYHYFASKEEILFACFQIGQEKLDQEVAVADATQGRGLDKLRTFIKTYALTMTEPFGMCLARVDDQELTAEARAELRLRKREVDRALRRFIAEGIADGSIRPIDARLTSFAIASALNGIGRWYRADGPDDKDAIATHCADYLTASLCVTLSSPPPPSP